jgi:aerobic-type carbon monoxide dehydrogenase small subunit (CoxS/CutS family)
MADRRPITVTVNGRAYRRMVEPRLLLSDFLRHDLRLTGTHVGCEHGVCGACTVLVDDQLARSCLMLAIQADGARITTVEGLTRTGPYGGDNASLTTKAVDGGDRQNLTTNEGNGGDTQGLTTKGADGGDNASLTPTKPNGGDTEFLTTKEADGGDDQVLTPKEADAGLHPVQQAFWDAHGLQCGFCTSGMLITTVDLLRHNPRPTDAQIRAALSGNLCRCTGYQNIVKAVRLAATRLNP